jgi:hypothetical protein
MSAAVTSEDDLLEYMKMPYSGTIVELFEDRLGLAVEEIQDGTLEAYVEKYRDEIWQRLSPIRKNYLKYLSQMKLDDSCAIVDLCYYGNNQRYLNKLLDTNLKGYYFNANLSGQNENTAVQEMAACFQASGDPTAENSRIYHKIIFIESVLTAPYGMVKEVDENGAFICAGKQQNQVHFQDKEEINKGIQAFIRDYMDRFGGYHLQTDGKFIDRYYGECLDGAFTFAETVKQSFYNDNAMMNRFESMLFY